MVATGAFVGHDLNVYRITLKPAISLKRKHLGSAIFAFEGGSTSRSPTTLATDDPSLELNVNFQRCLIRYKLC